MATAESTAPPPTGATKSPGLLAALASLQQWCVRNPLHAFLFLLNLATAIYFYGFVKLFVNGHLSAGSWAYEAWNGAPGMKSDGAQAHSNFVPFIALGLLWYHRDRLRAAPKKGSNFGLLPLFIGVALFVLSARALQPRMALVSIPFLIYGAVYFLWGKYVARVFLFPCAFLVFLVPFEAIEQATFRLQFVITGIVGMLAKLFHIGIAAVGTTLTATDGSFNFEIAEGCSGIRSLTALAMIAAIYVHLTQRKLWKKITIFLLSGLFAVIGNAGRIFTVILVAKYINPTLAAGIYHDYSGFVFFPIAVAAMAGFSRLLNLHYERAATALKAGDTPTSYDY